MAKTSQESSKEMFDAAKQEQNPHFNTDRKIRGKRLSVAFPVNVTHKGSPIHGWCEAQNLSFSGMLLLTNFPMNVKDEFTLEFTLPSHDIPVQTRARVVRVTHGLAHDEATCIAVSFVTLDPNVSKIISGFVLENLSSY